MAAEVSEDVSVVPSKVKGLSLVDDGSLTPFHASGYRVPSSFFDTVDHLAKKNGKRNRKQSEAEKIAASLGSFEGSSDLIQYSLLLETLSNLHQKAGKEPKELITRMMNDILSKYQSSLMGKVPALPKEPEEK